MIKNNNLNNIFPIYLAGSPEVSMTSSTASRAPTVATEASTIQRNLRQRNLCQRKRRQRKRCQRKRTIIDESPVHFGTQLFYVLDIYFFLVNN